MHPAEPTLAALPNPIGRYIAATRPPFLSVTLFGCLIGLGTAFASGHAIHWVTAVLTVVFGLLAHAGINVLNDYYDARNGTDAANTERLYPFTGGSRFIQNGVLTERETFVFGVTLMAIVFFVGLGLTYVSGPALFWIGISGLIIGWAYSAPPLKLNSRGLGELSVAVGWIIVAVGADYVQRHALHPLPVVASMSYALLVTNILYINQFPDRKADARAGKRHWVVRLAPQQTRWGYVLIAAASYLWLIGAVLMKQLPPLTLVALVAAVPAIQAARDLLAYAAEPARLRPAIQKTIGSTSLHGLLLAVALFASRWA